MNGPELVGSLEASPALSKVNVVPMGDKILVISANLEPVDLSVELPTEAVQQP